MNDFPHEPVCFWCGQPWPCPAECRRRAEARRSAWGWVMILGGIALFWVGIGIGIWRIFF